MERSWGRQLWLEGSAKLPRAGGMWRSEPGTSRPAGSIGAEGATCAKAGKARSTWTRTKVFSVGARVGPSVAAWGLYYMAPLSAPERSPVLWRPALCSARLPWSPSPYSAFAEMCPGVLCVSGSGQRVSFVSRLASSVRPACLPMGLSPCPWRMPECVAPSPGDLPDPGIEPGFPALPADSLPSEPPGKPLYISPCAKMSHLTRLMCAGCSFSLLYSFLWCGDNRTGEHWSCQSFYKSCHCKYSGYTASWVHLWVSL